MLPPPWAPRPGQPTPAQQRLGARGLRLRQRRRARTAWRGSDPRGTSRCPRPCAQTAGIGGSERRLGY
eukprot:8148473-Pyramimonas_sp.AAC.1